MTSPLSVKFQNTPPDASLVPGSVSGELTRAETLSAPTKYGLITLAKRTDSIPEDRT
ncbi:MAG: hypothetical protein ACXACI_01505 [Candidatus Hodarchaeales archaeon]